MKSLVDELRDMPPAELASRIALVLQLSPAQVVELQKQERRDRAVRLAARWSAS